MGYQDARSKFESTLRNAHQICSPLGFCSPTGRQAQKQAPPDPPAYRLMPPNSNHMLNKEVGAFRIRSTLARRLTIPAFGILGWIDGYHEGHLRGWAFDKYRSSARLMVEAWLGGTRLGSGPAATFREDVAVAGYGEGYCGFSFKAAIPPKSSLSDLKVFAWQTGQPTRRRRLKLSVTARVEILQVISVSHWPARVRDQAFNVLGAIEQGRLGIDKEKFDLEDDTILIAFSNDTFAETINAYLNARPLI